MTTRSEATAFLKQLKALHQQNEISGYTLMRRSYALVAVMAIESLERRIAKGEFLPSTKGTPCTPSTASRTKPTAAPTSA